jgi:hypothetical protein
LLAWLEATIGQDPERNRALTCREPNPLLLRVCVPGRLRGWPLLKSGPPCWGQHQGRRLL